MRTHAVVRGHIYSTMRTHVLCYEDTYIVLSGLYIIYLAIYIDVYIQQLSASPPVCVCVCVCVTGYSLSHMLLSDIPLHNQILQRDYFVALCGRGLMNVRIVSLHKLDSIQIFCISVDQDLN